MYGFIITTAGEGLLARASAGEGLTITEVWVGKGTVESAAAAKALTALLDPVAQATSTQPEVAGGQLSMLVEYRNDMGGGLEEGFTLSEFGVMAKVGDDAPTLLYYAALGDPAQPVPPIAEGLDVHRFPVAIGVTGEVEVSLEYPAGVWVTHEELEEALAGIGLSGYIKATEKGQPGGVATLGPDGKVPGEQLPKMDYDPAGSAEAVQKNLTAHTGNKNNPHAVTAEQVGALASSGGVMSGAISMSGHKIANLAAPADSTDAANKQYVDEHAGARVILGSYVGTGKTGKSNPNQITLAEPFKILCIYGMQSNNTIRVSTVMEMARLLILFIAVLSLLSIQKALVLVLATVIPQEILTVKNQRMEKLSVGILTLPHLMRQVNNLMHLELYITTTP